MTDVDVLVVGAGPVGLVTSAVLARSGTSHLTIDPAPLSDGTSRAAVLHARTLEVLDDLGVTLVDQGVVVPDFTVRRGERTLLRIGFDRLPTRFPMTLMVPQDVTERVLVDRLAELGGGVERARLDRLDVQQDQVRAQLDDGRSVTARWVVGADGQRSTVREQAGIAFRGGTYAESFALADVHLDWPLPPHEVQLFLSPEGLVVVAPLPHGRHRVVATVDSAPERPDRADLSRLLLDRGPKGSNVRDVSWSSRFRVHHRLAETFHQGPVLLAGDAAHVHSPAGGQGMNLGIRDAALLGQLLSTGDVDGYEAQRRPAAERVVHLTDRMTRAAVLRGPAARARDAALRLAGHVPGLPGRLAEELAGLRE